MIKYELSLPKESCSWGSRMKDLGDKALIISCWLSLPSSSDPAHNDDGADEWWSFLNRLEALRSLTLLRNVWCTSQPSLHISCHPQILLHPRLLQLYYCSGWELLPLLQGAGLGHPERAQPALEPKPFILSLPGLGSGWESCWGHHRNSHRGCIPKVPTPPESWNNSCSVFQAEIFNCTEIGGVCFTTGKQQNPEWFFLFRFNLSTCCTGRTTRGCFQTKWNSWSFPLSWILSASRDGYKWE